MLYGSSFGMGRKCKHSLQNMYGYSPNQFPAVFNNDSPALESSTASEVIAEHLNALDAARKA